MDIPACKWETCSYFQATRGIRQGFPLSPFLYIMLPDSLSRKLTAERNVGVIPGIRSMKWIYPINHALFVDDSLLLGGVSLRIARAFHEILQSFCSISGALINKRKSVVYKWNTNEQTILRIARFLGFYGFATLDKINYLGLPLTLGSNRSSLWNEVINKIKAKIAVRGWHWLNNDGKLILIKSVLSSFPIYWNYFLLAPKAIME